MESTNAKDIQLSNFEVYKLLKDYQFEGGQTRKTDPLATVRYETLEYLKRTPCVNQTEENIQKFLMSLKSKNFNLTKEQIIALLNHQPRNEVEISYLIENDTVTDETLLEILQIIAEFLPPHQEAS